MTALLLALSFCAAQGTLTHTGSDDSAVPPVAGNEHVCFLRVTDARSYEFSVDGETVCAQLAPRWRMYHPTVQRAWQHTPLAAWPMCYPAPGDRVLLRVRACNDDGCGEWSAEAVEFEGQPYQCFDARGEVPCNFQGTTP